VQSVGDRHLWSLAASVTRPRWLILRRSIGEGGEGGGRERA